MTATVSKKLDFRPVTAANAADFEALFMAPGGPKFCWCMVWRATAAEGRGRNTSSEKRHDQMLARIAGGIWSGANLVSKSGAFGTDDVLAALVTPHGAAVS